MISQTEAMGELECRRDRDPIGVVVVYSDDDGSLGGRSRTAAPSYDRARRMRGH